MGQFKSKMIIAVVGALVLHLFVAVGFLMSKNSAIDDYRMKTDDMKRTWEIEDYKRQEVQEEELVTKYGTTKLDRVSYDPRLSIKLVLDKLLKEMLPVHFQYSVSVDRFTEFKIYIKSGMLPDKSVLADYLKQMFTRVNPEYVYQIVFTDGEKYFVIHRDDIFKVGNWHNAERKTIYRYCLKN